MKSIVTSVKGKDSNQQLFDSYKVLRKNENRILSNAFDDYRKQFFENLPNSKEQGKFIKSKINSNKKTKNCKAERRPYVSIRSKSIANCLSDCFACLCHLEPNYSLLLIIV